MGSAKDGLRALGHQIRARRVALNMTQTDLGKKAGIVGKYVSEIERGTRDIPYSTLHAIVEDGLGLHLDITFAATTRSSGKITAPLPRSVEQVARMIADLTPDVRATVLAMVRMVLRISKK
ncbi:MAG: helix-turn-helix transcriptional regulator [Kofleriaceae bacterium]